MGILRVDHPDILEFITCKTDTKELTNFNISVGITEKLMEAVEDGTDYDLVNPRNGQVVGKANARKVFEIIVDQAWKNGEPGIIFLDRLNKDNPTPQLGEIESTNPCITGDALVPTEEGLLRLDEIARRWSTGGLRIVIDKRVAGSPGSLDATTGQALIEPGTDWSVISRAFRSGVKPVVRVTTKHGMSIEVTPDHKMMTARGWVKAGDLRIGEDRVLVQSKQAAEDYVVSVEPTGEKEVFDLTEPFSHSFVANGFVVSNCGEQPLLPFEACCLGSVNLGRFTKSIWGKRLDVEKAIDWDGLAEAVRAGVHFLDNLMTPTIPLPEITRWQGEIGRFGARDHGGILLGLKIPYTQGTLTCDKSDEFIEKESSPSRRSGDEKGASNWEKACTLLGTQSAQCYDDHHCSHRTISIICGASSARAVVKPRIHAHVLGKSMVEANPTFEQVVKSLGFFSDELMEKIASNGALHHIPEVPEEVRNVFVTAHEITPEWHIKMQAAFQQHTHNAVSKTVNFPREATKDEVKEVFVLANRLGCKGVTVYRDGSREEQVLTVGADKTANAQEPPMSDGTAPEEQARPVSTACGAECVPSSGHPGWTGLRR